ncbi:MAG: PhzF family phenazine biosynthesis protein [Gammaproteobacteria bacterium]|nr:PhzF family phenazine biosynthesis protein [Gammaproteobacteria bacterium]
MRYRYFICDVFTDKPFCGNQLAVLPEADGLSELQMQKIAREFNFAETTFVFPTEAKNLRKVRIFTPTKEIPFAGHPNIGTAFVLAVDGAFGEFEGTITVAFEEAAGVVQISIQHREHQTLWCELEAPQSLSLGEQISPQRMAALLCIEPEDIVTSTHLPMTASVGLPFLIVEVRDRDALERARANISELTTLQAEGICPNIHIYALSSDEFDIRARMFAPLDGIPEDPATGSANCALVALLSELRSEEEGNFGWRIAQGVELGRPSILDARTEKRNGVVTKTWIGGSSVLVSEGRINLG